ncbi:MAG: acyl carrier protein [Opitutales bacterium]|nr:acyl carrier protein [Opitutales bacterium]MCH8541097.1 acyl carrier protein [Opitutales bacterium]
MKSPTSILEEEIRRLLEQKGRPVDCDSFSDALTLREDLGLDSFDLAELTVHLEDRTGIDIFQEGVVKTMGEVRQRLASAEK